MNNATATLRQALAKASTAEGLAWLSSASAELHRSTAPGADLARLSAIARRKMGPALLGPGSAALATPLGDIDLSAWPAGDAARIVLVLQALAETRQDAAAMIEPLFRHGDEAERAAIVRALPLLDPGTELKPLILEAGRANSLILVTAVSQRNPYPAVHFSEAEFNQMVLKSLFLEIPIDPIVQLRDRANAELSRMCEDYYDERTAADRTVPPDIWLALGPHAGARGTTLMREHLTHADPRHRYYAAVAIGDRLRRQPELRGALEQMQVRETEPAIRAMLAGALNR